MTTMPNVQAVSNPLTRLSGAELRPLIDAYRDCCKEVLAAATCLPQEEAATTDTRLRLFNRERTDNLVSLERIIALTHSLLFRVRFLDDGGSGSHEVEALDLTLEAQRQVFDHYRARGWELRLDLAYLIDAYAVASGRASLADPLEWWLLDGPLAELIDQCNYFFDDETLDDETFDISIGLVEVAIYIYVQLRDELSRFSTGAGAN